jgi:hypothetical protein
MSTATAEPKVEETEAAPAKAKKEKRPFVLTPYQVRNQLNKALEKAGLEGNIQGPMVYSYAGSGKLGEITKAEDGREQVDPEKAAEFIAAFVEARKNGTKVTAKAETEEADEDAETDEDADADEADEPEDTDDEVEAE